VKEVDQLSPEAFHFKQLFAQFIYEETGDSAAKNVDEAKKLIEAGFEYVCTHENQMLLRKRKWRRHIVESGKPLSKAY
jgi:hypothetical protein